MPTHLKIHSFTANTDHTFTGLSNNYLPKLNSSGTGITNSQIFDNGTNVGFGTLAPLGKLHTLVSGSPSVNIFASDNYSSSVNIDSFVVGQIGGSGSSLNFRHGNITRGELTSNSSTSVFNVNSIGGYWLLLSNGTTESIGLGQGGNFIKFNSNSTTKMVMDGASGRLAVGHDFTPTEKIHISGGTIRIQTINATEGTGKLAISDANGVISFSSITALNISTGSSISKYVETVSLTGGTPYTITHGVGLDIIVNVKNLTTNEKINVTIDNYTTTTVDLTSVANVSSARVIIMG